MKRRDQRIRLRSYFYVPEFGKSTAELTEEEKNQVSHRGKALELMKEELKKYEDTDRK